MSPTLYRSCVLAFLGAAIAVLACGGGRATPPAAATAQTEAGPGGTATPPGQNSSARTETPTAGGAPAAAPVPLISSRGEAVVTAPPPAAGGGIDLDLPPGWVRQAPASAMRLLQASIPGPGGPGQFAVFFFGPGAGGSVDANIERWVGQVERSGPPPRPETFSAQGLRITWVEVAGDLKASTVGMGPSTAQPHSRLLGAVVEGPGGPWFFKATGPEATMAPARAPFLQMLHGVRPKS